MSVNPQCGKCPSGYCRGAPRKDIDRSLLPAFCPMKIDEALVEEVAKKYDQEEVRKIYVPATITEKEAFELVRGVRIAVRPRIKEIIEFSKLLGFKRLGVAFCSGLRDEGGRVVEFLEKGSGLEVASVMCKCGAIDKTTYHVDAKYKIADAEKFEAACNPILQAELLNKAKTDLNIIVGLCLGHDILFTKYSKAPVTTLIVKDRMLGHNPVIALYSGYHKNLIESQKRT